MAVGKSRFGGDAKFLYAKIKGLKAGETLYMEISEKQGNDYVVTQYDQPKANLSGTLIKIEEKSYEWEGDTVKTLSMWLKDSETNEVVILDIGMNSVFRSMVNSMASVEGVLTGEWYFSFYNKKDTGYPSVYVEYNGEKTNWKYDMRSDEWKGLIDVNVVKKKGKEVEEKDFYRLDEWLRGIAVDDIGGRVIQEFKQGDRTEVPEPVEAHDPADVADAPKPAPRKRKPAPLPVPEGTDDLPF